LTTREANLPRLLVLIDDFQNFGGIFGGSVYGSQVPEIELTTLITTLSDASSCGVHFVIGADRRSSIRSTMHSAISSRVVLRQGDESGYLDFGINIARGTMPRLPAGRGFWFDDKRVQFITDANMQNSGDTSPAELSSRSVALKLPELLNCDVKSSFPRVVVGIGDVTHENHYLDLAKQPLLVLGPRGSGRTLALQWLASQAKPSQVKQVRSTTDVADLKKDDLVIIDDADVFASQIEDAAILSAIRDTGCRLVFSINARNANNLGFGWLRDLARDASYLVLQPDDRNCQIAMSSFFDRLPYLRPGLEYPPGRGVISAGRSSATVHVPRIVDKK
jgi:S-DNA-T family DNA segregation ATPase FtsK/SpoIIIE